MHNLQISKHPQGSEGWFLEHVGKLSGTDMKTIMNGSARGWCTLLNRKRDEIENPDLILGEQIETPALLWGKENESKAISHYELIFDVDVETVGFVQHPTVPYVGCSPDFLFRKKKIVGEVKCPWVTNNHAMTVVHGQGVQDYKPQLQLELWVTSAEINHFISYDPRYPDVHKQLIVIPVERDEKYIAKMAEKCALFWDYLQTDTRPQDIGGLDEIPSIF